ncbi:MAG: hypothetical protein U0514_02115 [Candidatus Andersenbacteria bacterium]
MAGQRFGSDPAYACYEKAANRWVGPKDGLTIDIIARPAGFNRPGVVMLSGDQPVAVVAQNAVLSGDFPATASVWRFNHATGEWEGFGGTAADQIYTGSCVGGACTHVVADVAINPVTGFFGIVVADDSKISYIVFDGTSYTAAETVTMNAGGIATPAIAYDANGTPQIVWGGKTASGQPVPVKRAYRVGPSNWRLNGFGDVAFAADVATNGTEVSVSYTTGAPGRVRVWTFNGLWYSGVINPVGDDARGVSISYNSLGQLYAVWSSETDKDLLLLHRVGGTWQNMAGGTSPEQVTTDQWTNPGPCVLTDAADNPLVVGSILSGTYYDVLYTHWLP